MPHPSRAFSERVGVLTLRVDPEIHGFPALRLGGKGTASVVPLDPNKDSRLQPLGKPTHAFRGCKTTNTCITVEESPSQDRARLAPIPASWIARQRHRKFIA